MHWDLKRAVANVGARARNLRNRFDALRRTHPELIKRVALGTAGGLLLSFVVVTAYLISLGRDLPDAAALGRIGEMDQATAVFDAHDQLVFTIFKEQRIDVPIEAIAPSAIDALVSIEDQRFYRHHGFDWIRMGSAMLANVRRGRAAQGASTITQQLARMSFLTPDKTIRRKLQELMLARRIERAYSKRDILQLYLNKAYFGDGLYGIEAASRGFFGKTAGELSVAEAALLVGLVKSPSTYAPTIRLDRAVARRNVVLQAMRETKAIDQGEWESARAAEVVLRDGLHTEGTAGLYFKEQVRQELVERFGWQRVYQGGLRVYSTIDIALQAFAEQSVADGLKALDDRRAAVAKRRGQPATSGSDPLQAALVAMDPVTGHVRAMVGGRNFDRSHFNRAVQARRQPGSAFKPFVFAAALEAGLSPSTVIRNLNVPIDTLEGAWTPDDGHSGEEEMSLRAALRTSSNRAAVRLLQDVGIPKAVQYAKAMGVGNVPSVPSLALGSGEVTLQSLTAAYAGFANHGDVPTPMLIRRVDDRDGNVLFKAQEQSTHAISDTTAYLMSNMMADVINGGTGSGVRSLGFTLPAAGKTGTTNDYHDAWFVGFTPSLVAGVWVGFDQPKTILPNGYAADVAVPLWTGFMKEATRGAKAAWLRPPQGIVSASVCRLSGQLASEGCLHADAKHAEGEGETRRPLVYTELFARGTEPTSYCTMHPTSGIFGAIAAVFTGGEHPEAPHIADTRVEQVPPERAQVTVEPQSPVTPAAAEAPKKRGFWSRVFGRKDRPADQDREQ